MMRDQSTVALDQLIDRIDRLHSGPRVAQRIVALTREPEFDMHKVVDCLEHDPALSARILSVVNSSRYGLAQDVSSVRHAATFLGRRSLRLIVLTFSLVEDLARGSCGRLYSDFWRRALTMAHTAAKLARQDRGIAEDEAYTGGLLADVGILVLAQLEGERYRIMYDRCPHGTALVDAEQALLGFAHPALGARLLQRWHLPQAVVAAVAEHHEPPGGVDPLQAAVHAGDLMSDALWTPDSPRVGVIKELLEREFGLDVDGFIELAIDCRRAVEASAVAFGIHLPLDDGGERMLIEARRLSTEVAIEAAIDMDTLETAIEDLSA